MYAHGMSVRDIQAHVEEVYGLDISPQLVSDITEAVVDEVRAWQMRPLEPVYLAVYLDALVVKIRDKGVVINKSIYHAVGVQPDGSKDVLGMSVAGHLRRWPQRPSGCGRSLFPRRRLPDMCGTYGTFVGPVCSLEGPQGSVRRFARCLLLR